MIAIKEEAVLVRSFTLLLTAAQIIWRPIYCRFSLGRGRSRCRLIYVRCSQHLESLLAPSRFPVEPRKFVQLGLRRRYCANSWLRRRGAAAAAACVPYHEAVYLVIEVSFLTFRSSVIGLSRSIE